MPDIFSQGDRGAFAFEPFVCLSLAASFMSGIGHRQRTARPCGASLIWQVESPSGVGRLDADGRRLLTLERHTQLITGNGIQASFGGFVPLTIRILVGKSVYLLAQGLPETNLPV